MSRTSLEKKRTSNGLLGNMIEVPPAKHFSNDRLNSHHALVAAKGREKGIFAAAPFLPGTAMARPSPDVAPEEKTPSVSRPCRKRRERRRRPPRDAAAAARL